MSEKRASMDQVLNLGPFQEAELAQAYPEVEHYTITLAKMPNVRARLEWMYKEATEAHGWVSLEIGTPPSLLREALTKLELADALAEAIEMDGTAFAKNYYERIDRALKAYRAG